MKLIRSARVAALVALLAACAPAPVQPEAPAPKTPPKPSPATPSPMAMCAEPLATVIVIESQQEAGGMGGMGGMGEMGSMGGMRGDPYARLHIPPLARIARALAEKSGCFRTLEADPALLAMPGGVRPEIVLRVRAASIRVVDRSVVEKAADAAKRYIGRYTGGGDPNPEVLQSAQVSLELVCPRQRRVIQSFQGLADGPLGNPPLSGEGSETVSGANHERMAIAYAKAQNAALQFLRATPRPCL